MFIFHQLFVYTKVTFLFFISRCGESFTNAAKLVTHMRTIHGTIDKTYQCESCEYRGATHSALKAHMRAVHENVRKHRCDYCEFTSFASSALKRHILAIHEKRKPFECDKVCKINIFIHRICGEKKLHLRYQKGLVHPVVLYYKIYLISETVFYTIYKNLS